MKRLVLTIFVLLGTMSYSYAQSVRGPVTENSRQTIGGVSGPAVMTPAGAAVMKNGVPFFIPGTVAPYRPGPTVPQYFPPGYVPRTPFFW